MIEFLHFYYWTGVVVSGLLLAAMGWALYQSALFAVAGVLRLVDAIWGERR